MAHSEGAAARSWRWGDFGIDLTEGDANALLFRDVLFAVQANLLDFILAGGGTVEMPFD